MRTPTIFSRYVFRQAAAAMMLILVSLLSVVWIALALRQLDVVTSEGQSAVKLVVITTLAIPNLMAIIAPVALLIAAVHTLNRLNADSELIVLTASGATAWTVARPLLALALMVSLVIAAVNHFAMPWSLRELRETVLQMRTDLLTQIIQPGRFSNPERGLTIHIRDRTHEGVILGLLINDARSTTSKKGGSQSYLAERAIIVKQNGQSYLVMLDGHALNKSKEPDEPAQILAFEKYAIDLQGFEPKELRDSGLKPRESYLGELMNPDPDNPLYKRSPGQFVSELHERFANPLYPFVFVLLALAFVGQAQSTRQNRVEMVTGAFLAAICIRLGGLAANNLVTINPSLFPLLYAIPLVAIGASIVRIRSARQPKGGPSLLERLFDQVMRLWSLTKRKGATPNMQTEG